LERTEFESHAARDTEAVARQLAGRLPAGAVLLLYGDLGAGKTAFVRGLAAGLGVDPEEVSSPTFALVHEYRGRRRLQHVDLYRLNAGLEVEELGLEEFSGRGDIVAVEWADRLTDVPPGAIVVRIADLGESDRRITIIGPADAGDV
jgi:tRNA threonylcarbamoyladenosine biosynthesis protein TsaE